MKNVAGGEMWQWQTGDPRTAHVRMASWMERENETERREKMGPTRVMQKRAVTW